MGNSILSKKAMLQLNQVELELQSERQTSEVARLDYRPCLNCERHPRFPSIPAVTLHSYGKCLACNLAENEIRLIGEANRLLKSDEK